MTARENIRVALIGYGYAGKTFHAPLIQSVPGLQLVGVGSSRPDRVLADLRGVARLVFRQVQRFPGKQRRATSTQCVMTEKELAALERRT